MPPRTSSEAKIVACRSTATKTIPATIAESATFTVYGRTGVGLLPTSTSTESSEEKSTSERICTCW